MVKHIMHTASIVACLGLMAACNSAKRIAYRHNTFLLKQQIDTLALDAFEVAIQDSNVIQYLDTLISRTERLPEYDMRLKPLYSVSFKKENDTVLVDFNSDNEYITLLPDSSYDDKPTPLNVLNYRERLFFVGVQYDSANELSNIREHFFANSGKKAHTEVYRFISKRNHSQIDPLFKNTWDFSVEYLYNSGKLNYRQQRYRSITEPLIKRRR